ncbi:uncharacterized protein [Lolium perenne]|uniref:uncharacterized protein n=1 Tax=Lolium perenne TaxID=4522 RepID=UPI0021F60DFB|nr:uncharacterized protein LOC127306070 [Lolium perenne]
MSVGSPGASSPYPLPDERRPRSRRMRFCLPVHVASFDRLCCRRSDLQFVVVKSFTVFCEYIHMNDINAAARMRSAVNEKTEAEKILHIKRAEGETESK